MVSFHKRAHARRVVVNKRNRRSFLLLLGAFPFRVFAASSESSLLPGSVQSVLYNFRNSVSKWLKGAFDYITTKASELGMIIWDFMKSTGIGFVNLNKKAFDFLKNTGIDYFCMHWIEFLGALTFLIGLIVLIRSFFYKPRYILEGVPESAVPSSPDDDEAPKVRATPAKRESARFSGSVANIINPVDRPHVENAGIVFNHSATSDDQLNNEEFIEAAKNPGVDKEDLAFFQELSKDFNIINSKNGN